MNRPKNWIKRHISQNHPTIQPDMRNPLGPPNNHLLTHPKLLSPKCYPLKLKAGAAKKERMGSYVMKLQTKPGKILFNGIGKNLHKHSSISSIPHI